MMPFTRQILMAFVVVIIMALPLMGTTPQITIFKLLEVGFKDSVAEMITSKLQSELVATCKYKVLEREKVFDILKEQGFQQTGCTSSECLIEAGKLLNVTHIVTGKICKTTSILTISVRIIDIEKGEIISSAEAEVNGGVEALYTKGVSAVVAKLTTSISDLYTKASAAYNIKNYKEAIKLYDKIILNNADEIDAHYWRAISKWLLWNEYLNEDNKITQDEAVELRSDAISGLSYVISHEPMNLNAYWYRGRIALSFFNDKDYNAIVTDFSKVIKYSKDKSLIYSSLTLRAMAHSQIKNYVDEIKDLNTAIELMPNEPHAYEERAYRFMQTDKYSVAIKDYSKLLSIKPDDGEAYLKRAKCYIKLGNIIKAIPDYRSAKKGMHGTANINQGLNSIDEQSWNLSVYDWSSFFIEYWDSLSVTQKKEILPIFKEFYPNSRFPYEYLNKYYIEIGDHENAKMTAYKYLARCEDEYKVKEYYKYAEIFYKQGDYNVAKELVIRQLDYCIEEEKADGYRLLAEIQEEMGDLNEAIINLQKSLSLKISIWTYWSMGRIYTKLKMWDDALICYNWLKNQDQSSRTSPDKYESLSDQGYHLWFRGDVLCALGRTNEAIEDYNEFLRRASKRNLSKLVVTRIDSMKAEITKLGIELDNY